MMNDNERKEWLIGELAIARATQNEDYAMDLSMELYECFGWCGTPYYTH